MESASLFRSEEMSYCEIYLQRDVAFECVAALGEMGKVEFIDLNKNATHFQRNHVYETQRCERMEERILFLFTQISEDSAKGSIEEIFDTSISVGRVVDVFGFESEIEEAERRLRALNANIDSVRHVKASLIESLHVLRDESFLLDSSLFSLTVLCGVVDRERVEAFEGVVWRLCRGNVLFRQRAFDDADEHQKRNSFLICCQGEALKTRLQRVCNAFRARLYDCPSEPSDRQQQIIDSERRLYEAESLLKSTELSRNDILKDVTAQITQWATRVRKVKAVYISLNLMNIDVASSCLIAECWCPTAILATVRLVVRQAELERSGAAAATTPLSIVNVRLPPRGSTPPTYFRCNRLTAAFQGIVNAYSIAKYREINPMPFTVISFPFLFAVMFGDLGHGSIMFLSALFLVVFERQLRKRLEKDDILGIFYGGRYVILLMGAFSIYTGALYNDVFAKSINLYNSSWFNSRGFNGTFESRQLDPVYDYSGTPYALGMDPIWSLAKNKIVFINSMKMKMSVLLGVLQMIFGVMLSLINHLLNRNFSDIFLKFVPQMMFLLSIFVYMDLLIVWKWVSVRSDDSHCAPSILIGIINMLLFTYRDDPCSVRIFKESLQTLQISLVLVALLSVPLLLFGKPIYVHFRRKRRQNMAMYDRMIEDEDGQVAEDDDFVFSEFFIYEAIHTIEFVLGTISHTASYLRLWALSLAHSQLSDVLWTMVMRLPFTMDLPVPLAAIVIVAIFAFWALATLAILVFMEGLSAFLHALRLHWIEFNSKFFVGEGRLFVPFDLNINGESE